ncbi:uncharacterized protein RCC_07616 [Ramularia collo-cygni]|uniref:Uncharacterized protein n=1 Tax=Ramularia collo-cygni TaxID=112498 RepID=A0A2D3UXZ7_9PEZI|nr:uncharacterized protein RCC_07616 [Ramularia collo-cygni]CZT21751.1 uncharacterized protein RCC_07616 [Ramularia collo-cygni]
MRWASSLALATLPPPPPSSSPSSALLAARNAARRLVGSRLALSARAAAALLRAQQQQQQLQEDFGPLFGGDDDDYDPLPPLHGSNNNNIKATSEEPGSFKAGGASLPKGLAPNLKRKSEELEELEEKKAKLRRGADKKKLVEQPHNGDFAVADWRWSTLSPADQIRLSHAGRVDRIGVARPVACGRCVREKFACKVYADPGV